MVVEHRLSPANILLCAGPQAAQIVMRLSAAQAGLFALASSLLVGGASAATDANTLAVDPAPLISGMPSALPTIWTLYTAFGIFIFQLSSVLVRST